MKINLLSRFLFLCFLSVVATSAFTTAQTQRWVERYNGPGNQPDVANLLYVDAHGNAYAAGSSYDTLRVNDSTVNPVQRMAIVKYDSLGNQLWVAFDSIYSGAADAMTVDANGDVFVTGYDNNYTGSSYDVLKFDSMGVFQWIKYIGTGIQDEGYAITSDANYVYVTGSVPASGFPPYHNFHTSKLDIATGTTQSGWPQDYNGTGNNEDIPKSIAVDGSGNVFVTGSSINGSGDKDYVTIMYNGAGVIQTGWPQRWDGPSQTDDTPTQLVLSGNHVVVTGICNQGTIDTTGDIGTIMYDYAGNIVSGWPQIYNGTGNGWDGVGSTETAAAYFPMAVDASGNVYVTGWTTDTAHNYDIITFMYNAAGVIQSGWPQIYVDPNNDAISRGLVLDASNDVCITGFQGGLYNGDYITIEYSPSGATMAGWPVTYNGPDNGDDQAQAICAVGSSIWVTGYSTGVGTFDDFATIKYSNSNPTVSIKNVPSPVNSVIVFPNPSTGRFTINNTVEKSQLTITNVLGEVIYVSEINAPQTQVDLGKEAKGIYFYQLTSEDKSISNGKIVVQ